MTPIETRATRKALGLTQAEFADLLGISLSYVSQIERGILTPEGPTARIMGLVHMPAVANALAQAAGWSRRWAE